jgi:hypothetical protein
VRVATYALVCPLEASDRPTIERLPKAMQEDGYIVRSLI